MRKTVSALLVVLMLCIAAAPALAQETYATFNLRNMTDTQKAFAIGGTVSVLLDMDDELANAIPIIGAVAYGFGRGGTVEDEVEAAVINVLLYYTTRTVTSMVVGIFR